MHSPPQNHHRNTTTTKPLSQCPAPPPPLLCQLTASSKLLGNKKKTISKLSWPSGRTGTPLCPLTKSMKTTSRTSGRGRRLRFPNWRKCLTAILIFSILEFLLSSLFFFGQDSGVPVRCVFFLMGLWENCYWWSWSARSRDCSIDPTLSVCPPG